MEIINYLMLAAILAACGSWLFGLLRCWRLGRLHTLIPLAGVLPIAGCLVFMLLLPAPNLPYAVWRLLGYVATSLLVLAASQALFVKYQQSEQADVLEVVYYQYAITYSVGLVLALELTAWYMWR